MTEGEANELITVVKSVLSPWLSHPEADDLLGEAILRAYQVVTSLPLDCQYRWTTMAGRAARWQALEYLGCRRSGRLNSRRQAEAIIPCSLSDEEPGWQSADDGGIDAADARLQVSLLRPPLTAKEREAIALVYGQGLTLAEAGKRLGVHYTAIQQRLKAALIKYRVAAG